jgi:hypothetical protein
MYTVSMEAFVDDLGNFLKMVQRRLGNNYVGLRARLFFIQSPNMQLVN